MKRFLETASNFTRGALLIEPQPRKCYANARQRLRKRRLDFPAYLKEIDTKTIDPDIMIIGILRAYGSFDLTVLGQEAWGRSLYLFKKCPSRIEPLILSDKIKDTTSLPCITGSS
jgi:hypothetical protein